MKVHRCEYVDDRGHQFLGEGEGRVVLRIAADLQHPLAELGEGHRQVRGGGALADATLGVTYFQGRIERHLHAALAVGRRPFAKFQSRNRNRGGIHAATSS
jgi:hypothetical protein